VAHSLGTVTARASSAANPITTSVAMAAGETVCALLIKTTGATTRAGGAPTWGEFTLTQANSAQIAAVSPEASCEIWWLVNPPAATKTLTIPNTGAQTVLYTIVRAKAAAGGRSAFDAANGGNNTSANPTPGAVTCSEPGGFVVAITAGGWTTWAPSGQAGTVIANTDDGADGGGEQYSLQANPGAVTLSWTFATSDDWGAVVAAFKEIPAPAFENYQGVDCVSAGVISVGEKIR
jgi:hypothetical protein